MNTNIGEDGEVSDALQDAKPDANVLDPLCPGTPALTQVLVGINADLHNVVEQRKDWSKRESCHKDSDKPVLDHCREENILHIHTCTNAHLLT